MQLEQIAGVLVEDRHERRVGHALGAEVGNAVALQACAVLAVVDGLDFEQLEARGLKPATAFQANVYEVQGTVKLAPAGKGKQSVTIVWVVLGPDGTQLGVTRQTKTVRKGSLDKKWGAAAEAAAGAAAADIDKLIPR